MRIAYLFQKLFQPVANQIRIIMSMYGPFLSSTMLTPTSWVARLICIKFLIKNEWRAKSRIGR